MYKTKVSANCSCNMKILSHAFIQHIADKFHSQVTKRINIVKHILSSNFCYEFESNNKLLHLKNDYG